MAKIFVIEIEGKAELVLMARNAIAAESLCIGYLSAEPRRLAPGETAVSARPADWLETRIFDAIGAASGLAEGMILPYRRIEAHPAFQAARRDEQRG